MVADALVYHPTVAHYLKFVATTVGRDKLMRTLQYFSRFYAWYLYRLNGTPAEIAPFNAIKTQFGLIRKSLRLGKFVEHFKAAAQAWDAKNTSMDPFLRYCAIGRQLGYAGYMSCDNLHFLHVTGIRQMEAGRAKKLLEAAYRCWFAGLACNSVAGMYQLYRLRERRKKVDMKDGEGVVDAKRLERERSAVNLQLLSDICDITVPTFGLGYTGVLDDGLVGLAGTVSSLIGVYSVWKKTA
ncbi:MAG: Peroxisomal membrane protein PMP27 [Chrysothrix sp. TS-e1954]|nr:MAG: Peroxisomal membrane protein PMP27 [Chrysothrix sp. TS-e1954]